METPIVMKAIQPVLPITLHATVLGHPMTYSRGESVKNLKILTLKGYKKLK